MEFISVKEHCEGLHQNKDCIIFKSYRHCVVSVIVPVSASTNDHTLSVILSNRDVHYIFVSTVFFQIY
jgi:hypothetical protein